MKLLCTVLFIMLFSACAQTKSKSTDNSRSNDTSSNALNEYNLFVSKLDTFNVETSTTAAIKYQELFNSEDIVTKDKGFLIFNSYYEKLDGTINEAHSDDIANLDSLIMVDSLGKSLPISQKLKNYSKKLTDNGFQTSSSEGVSYIKQDRDFIKKWFYNYLSTTMKDYLEEVNVETKEGFFEDAGIIIEPIQFVKRLIWWENFVLKNPNFILTETAKEHKKYYLTFFLQGTANTPVLSSYETNEIDDYYKKAYAYLQDNFPNSETNKIVNPYFKALLQKDKGKKNALLSDYRKNGFIEN